MEIGFDQLIFTWLCSESKLYQGLAMQAISLIPLPGLSTVLTGSVASIGGLVT